jgi:hypothetical protein
MPEMSAAVQILASPSQRLRCLPARMLRTKSSTWICYLSAMLADVRDEVAIMKSVLGEILREIRVSH